MDAWETAFWTITIIGGAALIFTVLALLAKLVEFLCEHD